MIDIEYAVFKYDDIDKYGFIEDPEWGVDLNEEDCLARRHLNEEVGYHTCNRSIIWDDMEGYTDQLQDEENLPDDIFLVLYYWWDGHDLMQLVDVNITKAQIIQNVLDQKYREGADYFLMGKDVIEE